MAKCPTTSSVAQTTPHHHPDQTSTMLPSMAAHTSTNNYPAPEPRTPLSRRFSLTPLLNSEERERLAPSNQDAKQIFMTLDNPIHPIFAQSQFEHAPFVDYDVLKPGLRLASLLLDTPCLMDYWSAKVIAKPRAIINPQGKKFLSHFRKGTKCNVKEVATIRAAFLELAHHVKFVLSEGPGGAYMTFPVTGSSKTSPSFAHFKGDGFGSKITLPHSHYANLRTWSRLVTNDWSWEHKDWMLRSYANFATTMVHELAHAMDNARFGPSWHGMYGFEHQSVIESGFCWTATVFGGVPNFVCDDLRPWPSQQIVHEYLRVCASLRFANVAENSDLFGPGEVSWPLPKPFTRALFQKQFWEVVVPREGKKALEIPRVMGQRFGPQSTKVCGCAPCTDLAEEKATRIAVGCTPMEDWLLADSYEDLDDNVQDPSENEPTEPCQLSQQVPWHHNQGRGDSRERDSFALESGKYRSLVDGSVVRKENYRQMFDVERKEKGLTLLDASIYLAPEVRDKTRAKEMKRLSKLAARESDASDSEGPQSKKKGKVMRRSRK